MKIYKINPYIKNKCQNYKKVESLKKTLQLVTIPHIACYVNKGISKNKRELEKLKESLSAYGPDNVTKNEANSREILEKLGYKNQDLQNKYITEDGKLPYNIKSKIEEYNNNHPNNPINISNVNFGSSSTNIEDFDTGSDTGMLENLKNGQKKNLK